MALFFGLWGIAWLNLLVMDIFTAQHVNNLGWLTVYLSAERDTA